MFVPPNLTFVFGFLSPIVQIPLLVTFTFKSHKLQSDIEPSALPTQLVVSGSKDHPAPEIELIDKTVAFWTVIGFGEALPTFS